MTPANLPPPDRAAFYQAIRVLPENIVGKVEFNEQTGCWLWNAAVGQNGYPRVWTGNTVAQASRVVFESVYFELKPGMELGPLCRNKLCVCPDHMERGTRSATIRRGTAWQVMADLMRSRTHCPQGHPYDEHNTGHRSDGRRTCRACNRARHHRNSLLARTHRHQEQQCSAHP